MHVSMYDSIDDFNIYCNKCGSDDLGLCFKHGSSNIKDVMVLYCKKCDNNNKVGIKWDRYCRACGLPSVTKVCQACGYESLNYDKWEK